MKQIIIIILVFIIPQSVFWIRAWMYDDYEEYYPEEQYDDYIYEEEQDPYYDLDYDYEVTYNNGDNCFLSQSDGLPLSWCYLNGYCYEKPSNSSCSRNNIDAWECNKWYLETTYWCKADPNVCKIKWNLAYKTYEKIYYLPECDKYDEVEIREEYGERYFCSESDALREGFKKSYRCPTYENKKTSSSYKQKPETFYDRWWGLIWAIVIIGWLVLLWKES